MGIKRLSITWNAVRVFQALGLMAVGLLTPLIFTERNFRIYDLLYQAMNELDSGFLALGAIHLIALNTLRSGPDYLAITLLMDGISIQWNGREIPFVKIPFCCLFQISLYQVVYMVYSLRPVSYTHLDVYKRQISYDFHYVPRGTGTEWCSLLQTSGVLQCIYGGIWDRQSRKPYKRDPDGSWGGIQPLPDL